MIELVQTRKHRPFDDDTESADRDRRNQQRPPVAETEILQQKPRAESAHHVQRAVGKIDDVEQAENHGQPEREHGVERTVDEPDQKLAEQRLRGHTEDFGHGCRPGFVVVPA